MNNFFFRAEQYFEENQQKVEQHEENPPKVEQQESKEEKPTENLQVEEHKTPEKPTIDPKLIAKKQKYEVLLGDLSKKDRKNVRI